MSLARPADTKRTIITETHMASSAIASDGTELPVKGWQTPWLTQRLCC